MFGLLSGLLCEGEERFSPVSGTLPYISRSRWEHFLAPESQPDGPVGSEASLGELFRDWTQSREFGQQALSIRARRQLLLDLPHAIA